MTVRPTRNRQRRRNRSRQGRLTLYNCGSSRTNSMRSVVMFRDEKTSSCIIPLGQVPKLTVSEVWGWDRGSITWIRSYLPV